MSDLYLNQTNFDWSCTNKEFIIFVPNFGRKHLLIPTLKRFKTAISNDRWMWLVVNDGINEDLSDLEQYNLKWFTFEREPVERNGCMIRNFIIKRCLSTWLCTKDPEIILDNDIVSRAIDLEDVIYRPIGMIELQEWETQKIIDNPFINLGELNILRQWKVTPHNYQAFHNMVCIRTKRLQDMKGYEEDFKTGYGWEDVNMLDRLKKSGVKFIVDSDMTTYHIHHPIIRKFHKTIEINRGVYENMKTNLRVIANDDTEWGRGV